MGKIWSTLLTLPDPCPSSSSSSSSIFQPQTKKHLGISASSSSAWIKRRRISPLPPAFITDPWTPPDRPYTSSSFYLRCSSAKVNNNTTASTRFRTHRNMADSRRVCSSRGRPIVMVTNDDGIDAPGLRALVHVLVASNRFHVVVCAPDSYALPFFFKKEI